MRIPPWTEIEIVVFSGGRDGGSHVVGIDATVYAERPAIDGSQKTIIYVDSWERCESNSSMFTIRISTIEECAEYQAEKTSESRTLYGAYRTEYFSRKSRMTIQSEFRRSLVAALYGMPASAVNLYLEGDVVRVEIHGATAGTLPISLWQAIKYGGREEPGCLERLNTWVDDANKRDW